MVKKSDSQRTFVDTDYICERLVPPDSFFRKFKELVTPLIKDEDFDSMYCKDNGRPPISPSLLAMACILQFYRGLSDREMERACMFDIEIKYALGLGIEDRPFDHSSLGDFRERLLQNGKEKEIFDKILGYLVEKGLIQKDEIQRIDATHVIANIAIPTMVTLIKKSIYEILKILKQRYKNIYDYLVEDIEISEYSKEQVNHDAPGRLDLEKRKKKLVEVVADAKVVLLNTDFIGMDDELYSKVEMLSRILQEHITRDKNGNIREMDKTERPKDIIVSPIDPDARYGAKSKTKKFYGYKANVTETVKSRFITNIMAMPGNMHDGNITSEMVLEQKYHDIIPKKLIGDAAYSTAKHRKKLYDNGTKVVAPLHEKNDRTKKVLPKSMFKYDDRTHSLTCPKGITTTRQWGDLDKDVVTYHFPITSCRKCSLKKKCTNASCGRRIVGISKWDKVLLAAERHNKTEIYKKEMKMRQPIEGKLSEMKRYHDMVRARYRGIRKVGLQFYMTAVAVNVKRWISMALEKLKPKKVVLLPT
jgi:transposase